MASNKPSKTKSAQVEQMTCARIPTDMGEFQLCHYRNNQDDKEHLAFVCGSVTGKQDVLVRVHSECFTGDTMGSLRCDCGPQLRRAMQLIAAEHEGVVIYLRQEGRNIGLLDKLRAYNLQDAGYDTVEANLLLGHQADSRDYLVAALILKDLGVTSIRLLTNNPKKIESLEKHGVQVSNRIPLQEGVNEENLQYLRTKAERMRHMLDLELLAFPGNGRPDNRPFITLSYAQSLDGSIAARRGEQLRLSGSESMLMTHRLRAEHDAILVGVGTVLSDDPRLTVRLVEGEHPTPIILDSYLRTPPAANLLRGPKQVLIATRNDADFEKAEQLERAGARILRLPAYENGYVDLPSLLGYLAQNGIKSLMVEGGATVITSFLKSGLVDRLAVTITPNLVGGLSALEPGRQHGFSSLPSLNNTRFRQLGNDLVVIADVVHENE